MNNSRELEKTIASVVYLHKRDVTVTKLSFTVEDEPIYLTTSFGNGYPRVGRNSEEKILKDFF